MCKFHSGLYTQVLYVTHGNNYFTLLGTDEVLGKVFFFHFDCHTSGKMQIICRESVEEQQNHWFEKQDLWEKVEGNRYVYSGRGKTWYESSTM